MHLAHIQKKPETNPPHPFFPLIVSCQVDLIGYFDPTTSAKRSQTKGVQKMGAETQSCAPQGEIVSQPMESCK